jgi:hypothetical protein
MLIFHPGGLVFKIKKHLGAEESFPTDAYWNETIPPQKNESTSQ